jgi:hypothetical protein
LQKLYVFDEMARYAQIPSLSRRQHSEFTNNFCGRLGLNWLKPARGVGREARDELAWP